jgi:hypothetical protein
MKLKYITKYDKYKNNNESETQIQNNLKYKTTIRSNGHNFYLTTSNKEIFTSPES